MDEQVVIESKEVTPKMEYDMAALVRLGINEWIEVSPSVELPNDHMELYEAMGDTHEDMDKLSEAERGCFATAYRKFLVSMERFVCPRCNAKLTPREVATLSGRLAAAKRTQNGRKKDPRCKCGMFTVKMAAKVKHVC